MDTEKHKKKYKRTMQAPRRNYSFSSWENDVMAFDIILPDMSVISTLAVYAPSHKDTPSYWEHIYNELSKTNNEYKLILGDYNCTLDHTLDTHGYKTDPHKKSRAIIQGWLEN